MSRARQRIEAALLAKGYRSVSVTWEPLGPNVEMQGPEGGWVVEAEPLDPEDPRLPKFFPGTNVEMVLYLIGFIEERS